MPRHNLMRFYKFFEELALNLLEHFRYHNVALHHDDDQRLGCSHKERKKLIQSTLITVSDNWGSMSPIMLAVEAGSRRVTSSEVCWRLIRKVWWNLAISVNRRAELY